MAFKRWFQKLILRQLWVLAPPNLNKSSQARPNREEAAKAACEVAEAEFQACSQVAKGEVGTSWLTWLVCWVKERQAASDKPHHHLPNKYTWKPGEVLPSAAAAGASTVSHLLRWGIRQSFLKPILPPSWGMQLKIYCLSLPQLRYNSFTKAKT